MLLEQIMVLLCWHLERAKLENFFIYIIVVKVSCICLMSLLKMEKYQEKNFNDNIMKTKNKSVNMDLSLQMAGVLKYIEMACRSVEGSCYEMTITSAKDGKHMTGSKHYSGNAIDIRSKDMKNVGLVVRIIKKTLGTLYDVVFEIDHIHIEYDPK